VIELLACVITINECVYVSMCETNLQVVSKMVQVVVLL